MKRSLVSDPADSDSKRSARGDSPSPESSLETSRASVAEQFLRIELDLREELNALNLVQDPITCYYDPLEYAMKPHSVYVKRYCGGHRRIMFLGMNAGPYGMTQTGVPFGDVSMVRDWLGIDEEVGKPEIEHPSRPILGFQCEHKEVSGTRLWTLFKDLCGTPDTFFANCTVCNYCPLQFMSKTGKNVNVADVPRQLRSRMYDACDRSLIKVLELYEVRNVICIGKFVEKRAREALMKFDRRHEVEIHYLMHPSPINPAANADWQGKSRETLREIGLLDIIKGGVAT